MQMLQKGILNLSTIGRTDMEKKEIDRSILKYNFLKKIIVRFDYTGMEDTELEQILPDISRELKKEGYTDRTEKIMREIEIQYDDPESSGFDEMYEGRAIEQKVFIFHNQNPQIKLKVSSVSACIVIEKTKYVDCLTYCHILWKVMETISNSDKVPFFRFTRFGLRKINQCFLKKIEKLNEYFEPSHFRIFSSLDGEKTKEKIMQLKDSFETDRYNINLVRTMIKGEMQRQEAYQLNYDADIYLLKEENIKAVIQNEGIIEEMNETLFELYKDAVTENFLNRLIDGNIDENIVGVEAND